MTGVFADKPDREGKCGILEREHVGRQSGGDSQRGDQPLREFRPPAAMSSSSKAAAS